MVSFKHLLLASVVTISSNLSTIPAIAESYATHPVPVSVGCTAETYCRRITKGPELEHNSNFKLIESATKTPAIPIPEFLASIKRPAILIFGESGDTDYDRSLEEYIIQLQRTISPICFAPPLIPVGEQSRLDDLITGTRDLSQTLESFDRIRVPNYQPDDDTSTFAISYKSLIEKLREKNTHKGTALALWKKLENEQNHILYHQIEHAIRIADYLKKNPNTTMLVVASSDEMLYGDFGSVTRQIMWHFNLKADVIPIVAVAKDSYENYENIKNEASKKEKQDQRKMTLEEFGRKKWYELGGPTWAKEYLKQSLSSRIPAGTYFIDKYRFVHMIK
ncbi:MAG: hypothetical protein AABX52_03950 [Nanoarchaeota archaeon]